MTRSLYTPKSKCDLDDIGSYIARDNPRRAVSFLRELRTQCRKIAQTPKAYRLRPELGCGIRSCAYGHYVIFFAEEADIVRIIRVLHGAMDIEAHFAINSDRNDDPAILP